MAWLELRTGRSENTAAYSRSWQATSGWGHNRDLPDVRDVVDLDVLVVVAGDVWTVARGA